MRFTHDAELDEPGDGPQMKAAIAWCRKAKIPVYRPSPTQLKFENLNFFPTTGTLHYDNQRKLDLRGLAGLQTLLERIWGSKLPPID
ncbi:hypothetical protein [Sphingobium sp. YR768]|uniref:hypothetical protein n=1 Tax=Sphingobium sp. YR768 TaxID=1884365 RepID=UPI0008ADE08B|nr:hypothetical protein [Sphingobium sp. YR768]SER38084.1 hypothetical protein SAMN05518866_1103 [Sphingobium sp. YR768]